MPGLLSVTLLPCTPTPANPGHVGSWANVRQRDEAARTGEDGFVSVLGGMSRDLQLVWTDKVGWDFLQREKTTVRKTLLLLLVSPWSRQSWFCRQREVDPGAQQHHQRRQLLGCALSLL